MTAGTGGGTSATSDTQNQGKFACLQARVQVNLETIPAGFTRPNSPWHKPWDAPDTWNDWVGARVSFLWFDPPARSQKRPGETTNAYENVEPTNPQLANPPYCPNPQGCDIGDNTLTTERVSGVDNTQNFKGMIFGWDHTPADPNQRYYRRFCAASPYFDEPGGALPRICSLVTDEDPPRAKALLQMARYGGNNYVIIACLFLRGGNPPCIGPHYVGGHDPPVFSQYWQPGEGVNFARLNDLVVWRKVTVRTFNLPPAPAGFPPEENILEQERNWRYAGGPPDETFFETHIYLYLEKTGLLMDPNRVREKAVGAFDDAFVEIVPVQGAVDMAFGYYEGIGGMTTGLSRLADGRWNCGAGDATLKRVPPFSSNFYLFPDCDTGASHRRDPDTGIYEAHLFAANFLSNYPTAEVYAGSRVYITTLPLYHGMDEDYDPGPCWISGASYGMSLGRLDEKEHPHAYIAVGLWLHYEHWRTAVDPEDPQTRLRCTNSSFSSPTGITFIQEEYPTLEDIRLEIAMTSAHELGHLIGLLCHPGDFSEGCSSCAALCGSEPTVMRYSDMDKYEREGTTKAPLREKAESERVAYYCLGEISAMRERLRSSFEGGN